jgi:hypothetical protein
LQIESFRVLTGSHGADMSVGLSVLLRRATSPVLTRQIAPQVPWRPALLGLAALAGVIVAAGLLMMSLDDAETADVGLAPLTSDQASNADAGDEDGAGTSHGLPLAVTVGAGGSGTSIGSPLSSAASPGGSVLDANARLTSAAQPGLQDSSVLSGVRISSQSWRRGGLGSRALVTFTLRNTHPFAIKDVEINCAFGRDDGGPLTARRRVVPGLVKPGGRRTFVGVHVGFVNVNVSSAKCALVAATKI